MQYDPRVTLRPSPLAFNPFNALVAPRPIGWISTVDAAGIVNLAPFSYYGGVSADPPMVVFAPNAAPGDRDEKDTLANLRAVPEFVVNVVSYDLKDAMNGTSKAYPPDVDEMTACGLESAPSIEVRPPRVAAAPAALECTVHDIVALPTGADGRCSHLVIGAVVGIFIDDRLIVDGRVDVTRFRPVSRLGYFDYADVQSVFEIKRPV